MAILPSFGLRPSSDDRFTKLEIQIQSRNNVVFETIRLQIIPDKPQLIKSKDKNIEHYYSLYGKEWIKLEANSNNRSYKCLLCGKLYTTSALLFSHINVHRNERLHKCSYCVHEYFSAKALGNHVNRHHADKISWNYFCPVCDKKYVKEAAFIRHLETESAKIN